MVSILFPSGAEPFFFLARLPKKQIPTINSNTATAIGTTIATICLEDIPLFPALSEERKKEKKVEKIVGIIYELVQKARSVCISPQLPFISIHSPPLKILPLDVAKVVGGGTSPGVAAGGGAAD